MLSKCITQSFIVSAGIKTEESCAAMCAHSAYISLHILTKLKHSETKNILHHSQAWVNILKGPQRWEFWMSKVEYNVICFLIGLEALMLSALSLVKKRKAFRASAKPNDLSLEGARMWENKEDRTDRVRKSNVVAHGVLHGVLHGVDHGVNSELIMLWYPWSVKILLHWIEIDYCTMHINRCNPRLNFKSKSGLVLHAFRNI